MSSIDQALVDVVSFSDESLVQKSAIEALLRP